MLSSYLFEDRVLSFDGLKTILYVVLWHFNDLQSVYISCLFPTHHVNLPESSLSQYLQQLKIYINTGLLQRRTFFFITSLPPIIIYCKEEYLFIGHSGSYSFLFKAFLERHRFDFYLNSSNYFYDSLSLLAKEDLLSYTNELYFFKSGPYLWADESFDLIEKLLLSISFFYDCL